MLSSQQSWGKETNWGQTAPVTAGHHPAGTWSPPWQPARVEGAVKAFAFKKPLLFVFLHFVSGTDHHPQGRQRCWGCDAGGSRPLRHAPAHGKAPALLACQKSHAQTQQIYQQMALPPPAVTSTCRGEGTLTHTNLTVEREPLVCAKRGTHCI